uniref:F-box domain-containing protein n=1 Tax=Mycena chlorophos TaxID=658473 RepID=A0ABQ0L554_MYCCL|nr:predicted protein [Mycena chlorophos]
MCVTETFVDKGSTRQPSGGTLSDTTLDRILKNSYIGHCKDDVRADLVVAKRANLPVFERLWAAVPRPNPSVDPEPSDALSQTEDHTSDDEEIVPITLAVFLEKFCEPLSRFHDSLAGIGLSAEILYYLAAQMDPNERRLWIDNLVESYPQKVQELKPADWLDTMSAARALPPELTDTIISNIKHKPTLRSCALVCRSWVPASRHALFTTLSARGDDIGALLALLSTAENTVKRQFQRVELSFAENGPTQALIRLFPECAALRKLRLDSTMYYYDFPVVSQLTHLELSKIQFGSFAHFLALLSRLPSLKSLKLEYIEWAAARGWAAVEIPDKEHMAALNLDRLDITLSGDRSEGEFLDWLGDDKSAPRAKHLVADVPFRLALFQTYLEHTATTITRLHLYDRAHILSLQSLTSLQFLHLTHDGGQDFARYTTYFSNTLPILLDTLLLANAPLAQLTIDLLLRWTLTMQLSPDVFERLKGNRYLAGESTLEVIHFNVACPGHKFDEEGRLAEGHYHPGGDLNVCAAERIFRTRLLPFMGFPEDGNGKPRCVIRLAHAFKWTRR